MPLAFKSTDFTPEILAKYSMRTDKLRMEILWNCSHAGAAPLAEQYYLLGLTALEQAGRFFNMASLTQSRELVG